MVLSIAIYVESIKNLESLGMAFLHCLYMRQIRLRINRWNATGNHKDSSSDCEETPLPPTKTSKYLAQCCHSYCISKSLQLPSYEVKFFELTLDNFGMLQCTEWEPNGSFNKLSGTTSASGQGVNYSQERFLILHCHLTHVKLSCIVHPSLTFWRFWPLCLMSSLLMEFFYSTYLLQLLQAPHDDAELIIRERFLSQD
ncbi:putative protein SCAI [Helianthus annuus]|nr:putative protein SCAI [Helianthus annuus]KAJ0941161.1 putative protein SCAI [Helianthus annuus]